MAITVHSEFWNSIGGSDAGYAMQSGKTPIRGALKRLFRKWGLQDFDALTAALTGAAVGGTATATAKQVQEQQSSPATLSDFSGNRVIQTYTFVNRVTVAGDETDVDNLLTAATRPAFPANLAANNANDTTNGALA